MGEKPEACRCAAEIHDVENLCNGAAVSKPHRVGRDDVGASVGINNTLIAVIRYAVNIICGIAQIGDFLNGFDKLQTGIHAPASEKKVALPDGFPDELRPHLKAAYRVLRDLAERHAAKEVNVCALAQIVMANHRKPLVQAAHECAAHFEGRGPKDVVACYRNWLRRVDALAVVEPLDEDGRTTQIARPGGLRVHVAEKSQARMDYSRAQLQRFAEREQAENGARRLELTA